MTWKLFPGYDLTQSNGSNDCALFVCRWLLHFSRNTSIEIPMELTREELARLVSK